MFLKTSAPLVEGLILTKKRKKIKGFVKVPMGADPLAWSSQGTIRLPFRVFFGIKGQAAFWRDGREAECNRLLSG